MVSLWLLAMSGLAASESAYARRRWRHAIAGLEHVVKAAQTAEDRWRRQHRSPGCMVSVSSCLASSMRRVCCRSSSGGDAQLLLHNHAVLAGGHSGQTRWRCQSRCLLCSSSKPSSMRLHQPVGDCDDGHSRPVRDYRVPARDDSAGRGEKRAFLRGLGTGERTGSSSASAAYTGQIGRQ